MMTKLAPLFALAFSAAAPLAACSAPPEDAADAEEDEGPVGEASEAATGAYCPAPYTGRHSRDARYMHPKARAALAAAGVPESAIQQSYGDAKPSVGTHCPEAGQTYSAATDLSAGSSPCARTHALRMRGFAAFYRVPSQGFSEHIHAVYAGAPVIKASLRRQIDDFYRGIDGLAGHSRIETHCPITAEEQRAVRAVAAGGSPPTTGGCVAGSNYCGGDKVDGDPRTLYRCEGGSRGTALGACHDGCLVRSGDDDTCRGAGGCVAGSYYCGGDKVAGEPDVLYRCVGGDRGTVVRRCANGCRVNSGDDDACR